MSTIHMPHAKALIQAIRYRDFTNVPEVLRSIFSPFIGCHCIQTSSPDFEQFLRRVFELRQKPDREIARVLLVEARQFQEQLKLLEDFNGLSQLAERIQVYQLFLIFKCTNFSEGEIPVEVAQYLTSNIKYFKSAEITKFVAKVDIGKLTLQQKYELSEVSREILLQLYQDNLLDIDQLSSDQVCNLVEFLPEQQICKLISHSYLEARHIVKLGQVLGQNKLCIEFLCFLSLRSNTFNQVLSKDRDQNHSFYVSIDALQSQEEQLQFIMLNDNLWLQITGLIHLYYRNILLNTQNIQVLEAIEILFQEVQDQYLIEFFSIVELKNVINPEIVSANMIVLIFNLIDMNMKIQLMTKISLESTLQMILMDQQLLVYLSHKQLLQLAKLLQQRQIDNIPVLAALYPYLDNSYSAQVFQQQQVLNLISEAEQQFFMEAQSFTANSSKFEKLIHLSQIIKSTILDTFDGIYRLILEVHELYQQLQYLVFVLGDQVFMEFTQQLIKTFNQNQLFKFFSSTILLYVPVFTVPEAFTKTEIAQILFYKNAINNQK